MPAERIARPGSAPPRACAQALELAAERIRAFHERQPRNSWLEWDAEGGALGQIVRPLERVGIYAPNGRAPYPSSLLMAAIPARVAGVPEVVVATPPREGELNDTILAAAHVAGVREVYAIGGAQAIGALAYGTAIGAARGQDPGPGQHLCRAGQTARLRHRGHRPAARPHRDAAHRRRERQPGLRRRRHAGPGRARPPGLGAADHPVRRAGCSGAAREIAAQLRQLPRNEIIRASLAGAGRHRGGGEPGRGAGSGQRVRAGAPLPAHRQPLGSWWGGCATPAASSWASSRPRRWATMSIGPSHIMPTGQTARFSSPVNVWDFVKITSVFGVSPSVAARRSSAAAITIWPRSEGLTAHAQAVRAAAEGA